MKYVASVGDRAAVVEITGGEGRYRIALGDEIWEVDARATGPGTYSLLVEGIAG